jgi:calcium/calmodulin-dependent protein kinase I
MQCLLQCFLVPPSYIHSGSFATVKLAEHRTDGSKWAVKIITKSGLSKEDAEALDVEVEVLSKVKHPNIVEFKEIFDCTKTFYLVMELMEGGELFDRIVEKEKYSEKEAQTVIIELASALDYCHELNVVHRDLKPENLLYKSTAPDAKIKIADFGLAKLLDDETIMMKTACGTPGYVAPEILESKPYSCKVDMWSLGVILYILLCGFPPFYDDNNAKLFAQIKSGRFHYPKDYWHNVSDDAKDLINKLLVVDPALRLDAKGVLNHKWIKGTASEEALTGAKDELKKFQAKKRLKLGMKKVAVVNAFSHK